MANPATGHADAAASMGARAREHASAGRWQQAILLYRDVAARFGDRAVPAADYGAALYKARRYQ